ncbi:hypothetical protein [Agarivorans sp. Alg241-V36]|uniref:hypothetical protein n=1 Tax=Agarivorans sp. Alg241-V36 TaxID=2305992 RepID=UPI0013D202EA|nr:hypothetical protein [Agarivorans sp. Alg241-V36]
MDLNKEQEFLLNGIQELTEDEMISIAGGYGEPTTPGTGTGVDDTVYEDVWVSNPYGPGGSWVSRPVNNGGGGTSYGG